MSSYTSHVLLNCHFSYDEICDAIRAQQNQIVSLDMKVTATIDTVVNIGEQVIKHSEEITEIHKDVDELDERVDDVEEDIGETKIKVEEIDNKASVLKVCVTDSMTETNIMTSQHFQKCTFFRIF